MGFAANSKTAFAAGIGDPWVISHNKKTQAAGADPEKEATQNHVRARGCPR